MDKKTVQLLSQQDKTLAKWIEKIGAITLKPQTLQSPYEALVESVVYQQLNGKAAASIFAKVKALFPDSKFPTTEDFLKVSEERLRSAGLSRAKMLAIKDIALKTEEGIVPTAKEILKMEDAEIIERLTTIRGVGQWTAEMLLIFTLGRPDVLPATDYGIRKGFAKVYRKKELPHPKKLMEFGERWRPYRTTAAWYLWRSLDLNSKT